MCMCLVLFVVSEIPESSRLLSCFFLYEIRIECNLLSRMYQVLHTAITINTFSLL